MKKGVPVAVRVKPGAHRNQVGGGYPGPFGPAVVIAVQARAVDGAATEAVRRSLASALGVRPATVTLRSGPTSKDKLFMVDPAPDDLAERITRLRSADGAAPGGSDRHVPPRG